MGKIIDGIIYSDDMETVEGVSDKGIKSAIIPDGVKYVVMQAFKDCTALEEVSIPDSMLDIKKSAFKNCTSLMTVSLGDNVECLDSSWFFALETKYEIKCRSESKTYKLIKRSSILKSHVKELSHNDAKSEKIKQVQGASIDAVLSSMISEGVKYQILTNRKTGLSVFFQIGKNVIGDVDFNHARTSLMMWENGTIRYEKNLDNCLYIIYKIGLSIDEMKHIIDIAEPFRNIDDAGYDELSQKTIKELVLGKVKNVFQNIQEKTEKIPLKKRFNKQTSQKILDEVKKRSKTPVLRFPSLWKRTCTEEAYYHTSDSKFGGFPWWNPSKKEEFPTDEKGRKMILLAQLNMRDLSSFEEAFPDFPEKGILQFFISPYAELDFDDSQKNWRVVYHEEDSGTFMDAKMLREMGVKTAEDFKDVDGVYLPFYDTFSLKTHQEEDMDYINPCCEERFERLVREVIKDFGLKEPEENTPIDEIFYKPVYEAYWDECKADGHKVGGYPTFCQGDARDRSDEFKDHDVLLLQIDTDEGIMWGDSGVANFFIKREDLRNLDFSNVLFTWDCC